MGNSSLAYALYRLEDVMYIVYEQGIVVSEVLPLKISIRLGTRYVLHDVGNNYYTPKIISRMQLNRSLISKGIVFSSVSLCGKLRRYHDTSI